MLVTRIHHKLKKKKLCLGNHHSNNFCAGLYVIHFFMFISFTGIHDTLEKIENKKKLELFVFSISLLFT